MKLSNAQPKPNDETLAEDLTITASVSEEKVLGPTFSRVLYFYYRHINHPSKVRLWYGLNRWLGWPKLIIPYDGHGWLAVDQRDLVQRMILSTGYYEPQVWEALAGQASRQEIFWDIGAHIGSVSVRAALDTRIASVHAFEPSPLMSGSLRTNVALNQFSHVHLHAFALSEKSGEQLLYFGPSENRGMTGLSDRDVLNNSGSCRVKVKTVDEMIQANEIPVPTLIKMDVEGFELSVLKGAAHLLKTAPPKAIAFEAKCKIRNQIDDPHLPELLRAFGFEIRPITSLIPAIDEMQNFLALYEK